MAAKVHCKKGYDGKDGYVEFKKISNNEYCPASNADCCAHCETKHVTEE